MWIILLRQGDRYAGSLLPSEPYGVVWRGPPKRALLFRRTSTRRRMSKGSQWCQCSASINQPLQSLLHYLRAFMKKPSAMIKHVRPNECPETILDPQYQPGSAPVSFQHFAQPDSPGCRSLPYHRVHSTVWKLILPEPSCSALFQLHRRRRSPPLTRGSFHTTGLEAECDMKYESC